jgi:hypothetical protein
MSCRSELRNPCGTLECVVTYAMGEKYEARPVFEVVTHRRGDMPCQKLSSLNQFYFEYLQWLLIILWSSPTLKFNEFGIFGETYAKLVIELDITDNQCYTSLSDRVG